MSMPPLTGNHDLYNLQGQINHKIEFIRKFVGEEVKIHLVSHSIGAKISLELLKHDLISQKIHRCYLMFPTIERMVESNNGFWFYKVFDRIFFLLQLIYYGFSFLPLTLRTIFLYFFCLLNGIPNVLLGTVIKVSSPTAIDKVWFMAKDEMEKVCQIDDVVIKKNQHRLNFYYGMTDGWVPIDSYKKLVERFPGINAELCQKSINHCFMISHGPTMARMVADWLRRNKVK